MADFIVFLNALEAYGRFNGIALEGTSHLTISDRIGIGTKTFQFIQRYLPDTTFKGEIQEFCEKILLISSSR